MVRAHRGPTACSHSRVRTLLRGLTKQLGANFGFVFNVATPWVPSPANLHSKKQPHITHPEVKVQMSTGRPKSIQGGRHPHVFQLDPTGEMKIQTSRSPVLLQVLPAQCSSLHSAAKAGPSQ